MADEYEKFNEILTVATKTYYGLETSKTYFDCTFFYFEIDKENRKTLYNFNFFMFSYYL